ncbi:MAG TPA: LysR substrate-binding domain-containing protein [Solirubrobacteraceae bacterium]|jgi:DNA-binding transcriptional LysR family regulator|nr:LysR substrate-binding domain-containing protein [Solirubrobacteraceae bacterium]
MLNPSRLQVLREVVRRGSFSAAADALSYTQSAVSQAVARLEAETGAPLVVRDRRGVRPTAAGETLVEHADTILSQIETAQADLDAVLGVRAGRLRVASFPSAGATLMPLAVALFRERHPGVALSLAEGEPEEIAPRVRGGELDLALLFDFPGVRARPGAGLGTVHLLEDPMDVALPAQHRLARKRALRLSDLGDQDWVQTSAASPCARHLVRLCLGAGFEPRVTFESDDYETVQGLVAAGVGVALIPRLALTHVHPGVVIRSLDPRRPVRHVVAATPDSAGASPAARAMLEILSDVSREYAAARG